MKDMVKCMICGKRFKSIVNSHLKKHNITMEEYSKKYPNAEMFSEGTRNKIKKANTGRKFGTYEEQFGKERADSLKDEKRTDMINRFKDGIIKKKMTKPHKLFLDALIGEIGDRYNIEAEYVEKYYAIDIAIPDKKVAIEIHGNYFHNKDNKPEEELSEMQIKNVCNDKRKSLFLKRRGWRLFVVWENEVLEDLKLHIKKIIKEVDKNIVVEKYDYSKHVKKCAICGKKLKYNRKKYCSRECMGKCKKGKKTYVKECVVCGNVFKFKNGEGFSPTRTTCSKKCQKIINKEKSKNSEYNKKRRKEGRIEFVCSCGEKSWTHARSMKKNKNGLLFCSHKCYLKYHPRFNKEKK